MKLILKKKPKNVTIIEGFPGFGLIGTIVTEFLMEHLKTEKIGVIEIEESPAMIAIHQNKVIEPVSIHYNKEFNLVLIHALNVPKEVAWQLAEKICELVKILDAKEIISIEGVGSPNPNSGRIFYFSSVNGKTAAKMKGIANPLMEGIIVGVTGALLTKDLPIPMVALFAEAKSTLPDSEAAAHIIKALDAYAGLNIDPKPLMKQAAIFEEKLKGLVEKSKKAGELQEDKMAYVG